MNYAQKCRAKLTSEKKKYLNQYYCRSWTAWIGRHTHTAAAEDRIKNREFNITTDYVRSLLEQQSYKCLLTNILLRYDKSLYSMSIDRINNNLGHVVGNIQAVCRGVNLAKNRHTNPDVQLLIDNIRNNSFNEIGRLSRDYISTCVRNGCATDLVRGRASDIDTDYILSLFEQQNGRCYFTGIKMVGRPHPCFSISIDRVNNTLGHIKGNVRLVLKAINRAKKLYSDDEVLTWIKSIRRNQ
jgi:hypothetical protein